MSSEINIHITATDDASGVMEDVASNTAASMGQVQQSGKQTALAFSGVATASASLIMSFENVENAQITLDRANVNVEKNTRAVEKAQTAYNDAVAKYGANSPQAVTAANNLAIAQDSLRVAHEKVDQAQRGVTNSMMMAAVTVIPSLITMISSISMITTGWTSVTEAAGAAMDFLAANPIVLVIVGIVALVASLIYAYNNCKPFRDAINEIAGVLSGAFGTAIAAIQAALQWLWNNVLMPLGKFLVADFLAQWNLLSTGISFAYNNIIKPVWDAISWAWNNVLVPLGKFLIGTFLDNWNALCKGVQWAYNNVMKPVFDAITWVWNNVLKPVADAIGGIVKGVGGALSSAGNAISGAGSAIAGFLGFQHGVIVTSPTLALVGEAGPEAIIPLSKGGGFGFGDINISLEIEGSVDRKTADYAVQRIRQELKNVIVEATSSQAGSTHKRIRNGAML